MPPIERTGTGSVTQAQAQQNTNAAETIGQLGSRTVRQGKADGSGLTIKSAFTKIADFLRAGFEKFKSLQRKWPARNVQIYSKNIAFIADEHTRTTEDIAKKAGLSS